MFELIKNIELVCFIPPNSIKAYIKFLKLKLNNEKEKLLFKFTKNLVFQKLQCI